MKYSHTRAELHSMWVLVEVELQSSFRRLLLRGLQEHLLAVDVDPGPPLLAVLGHAVEAALVGAVDLQVDGAVCRASVCAWRRSRGGEGRWERAYLQLSD